MAHHAPCHRQAGDGLALLPDIEKHPSLFWSRLPLCSLTHFTQETDDVCANGTSSKEMAI
jgi:hypothetical protein